jgi:hypothetical protein
MTTETRTYIPFSDLIGLEIACPHCQARITYVIEKFDRFTSACPNCREQWFTGPDVEFLRDFLGRLEKVKSNDLVAKIMRLQVVQDAHT